MSDLQQRFLTLACVFFIQRLNLNFKEIIIKLMLPSMLFKINNCNFKKLIGSIKIIFNCIFNCRYWNSDLLNFIKNDMELLEIQKGLYNKEKIRP